MTFDLRDEPADALGTALAFELIRRDHGRAMRRLAHRMVGDRFTAEDVVQEALLRVYVGLPTLRAETSVRAWVMSVTAHAALDELRRRARRRRFTPADETVEVADRRPDARAALEQAEEARLVAECVAALPPKIRASILLRFGHDLTFDEVADLLADRSGGTVRIRVVRALERIRPRLHRATAA